MGASGCSGPPAADQADPVRLPLATSVTSAGGTWAVVPAGQIDDPHNTLWQLLEVPPGTDQWTDDVTATGAATNGGLVLAAAGPTVEVAVVPFGQLQYSPVVAVSSGTSGPLPVGIKAAVSALAVGPGGRTAAVTGDGRILEATGTLDTWRPVAGLAQLSGAVAVNGVTYGPHGTLMAGATAGRPGRVDLYERGPDGQWSLVGPELPASDRSDRAEVVWLGMPSAGVTALVALTGPGGDRLTVTGQSPAGTGAWAIGPTLAMPDRDSLLSVSALDGQVLVLQQRGRRLTLDGSTGPDGAWTRYPTPPAGTVDVLRTVQADAQIVALSVDGARLTSYTLDHKDWRPTQTLTVPLESGTSG